MKKKIFTSLSLFLIVLMMQSMIAFANDMMRENPLNMTFPQLISPLNQYSDPNVSVGSSWNEPRSTSTDSHSHTGVDQGSSATPGMQINAMYYNNATIYQNLYSPSGGNFQVISYTYNGKPFYSIYMHLQKWVKNEGDPVSLSDTTALSGNTGPSGTPYHLHWELLETFTKSTSDIGPRTSVNPANYVNMGSVTSDTISKFTVFKNYAVYNYRSTHKCTIQIDGIDTNSDKPNYINKMFLYYRPVGTSTWSYTDMYPSNGHGSASITGNMGDTYELFIAGVRSIGEYWVTYPARYTKELGAGSMPSVSGLAFYTKTVTIP